MYKTASSLRITSKQRAALIATKAFLKRGVERAKDVVRSRRNAAPRSVFLDMRDDWHPVSCGTACCIGGFMTLHMLRGKLSKTMTISRKESDAISTQVVVDPGALYPLFFPQRYPGPWDEITSAQAVKAINNFLTTGDPKWDKV
jgi:hypothetical protein